jgi:hypothetical protein
LEMFFPFSVPLLPESFHNDYFDIDSEIVETFSE